tara:strand:+ start:13782 stop:14003 length:222 start_codon:yes stop_codon:yes gene_type:complete
MKHDEKWYTIMVTVEGKENMLRVNKMLDEWNKKAEVENKSKPCPQCQGYHVIKHIDTADSNNVEIVKMGKWYK